MKLNVVPSIIAVAISALVAYGFYSFCKYAEMNLVVAIVGGLCMLLTLGILLGVSVEQSRTTVNIKVASGVFAGLLLTTNIIFCCVNNFALPLYIIVNGIILLTWLIIICAISRAMK